MTEKIYDKEGYELCPVTGDRIAAHVFFDKELKERERAKNKERLRKTKEGIERAAVVEDWDPAIRSLCLDEGYFDKEIAGEIGETKSFVYQRMKKMGLLEENTRLKKKYQQRKAYLKRKAAGYYD